MEWAAYIIVGILAGIIGGLFGIGGGVVTVPCLLFIFHMMDFPPVYLMQLAIGTSLAAMVFNTLGAVLSHHKKGAVLTELLKKMAFGLIFGSIVGAFFGHLFPAIVLQLLFAIFLIYLGIRFYRHKEVLEGARSASDKWTLPSIVVGGTASFLGIGGGIFSVPFLVHRRVPMKKAVGTASATSFIISLFGALSYLVFGLGETYYPLTLGYIYLPAFIVLAVVSFLTAPLGTYLAHRLPNERLKKYFAIVLVLVGVLMLIR